MKKIVKIVAIMAVLSTVFVGCKKPTDDPADSQPKAPATGTETGNTDGDGNTAETDDTSSKVTYTLDTSGIWSPSDTTATQTDDKIEFNVGHDWQVITLNFAEPVDMSKGMIINAKISDDWEGNGLKFGFVEENDAKESETDMSKWSITNTASDITITADLTWKGYSEDGHISAADLTKVSALKVLPQQCRGTITINSIKVAK